MPQFDLYILVRQRANPSKPVDLATATGACAPGPLPIPTQERKRFARQPEILLLGLGSRCDRRVPGSASIAALDPCVASQSWARRAPRISNADFR